jgi:quercetin dioxygenase-like cupin family protein
MRIFRGEAVRSQLADSQTFVGRAHTQRLASADDGVPVVVYNVEFEDGARTNWHAHSGPQWLLIVGGRVRVQTWGEPAQEVGAGDAVMVAAHEKHWHGAAPGSRATHLAVNVNFTTQWFEPVSDDEYGR